MVLFLMGYILYIACFIIPSTCDLYIGAEQNPKIPQLFVATGFATKLEHFSIARQRTTDPRNTGKALQNHTKS